MSIPGAFVNYTAIARGGERRRFRARQKTHMLCCCCCCCLFLEEEDFLRGDFFASAAARCDAFFLMDLGYFRIRVYVGRVESDILYIRICIYTFDGWERRYVFAKQH